VSKSRGGPAPTDADSELFKNMPEGLQDLHRQSRAELRDKARRNFQREAILQRGPQAIRHSAGKTGMNPRQPGDLFKGLGEKGK
jgi:hypothetical protein